MTFNLKLNNRNYVKTHKLKGKKFSLPKNLPFIAPKLIVIYKTVNKRQYGLYLCQCGAKFTTRVDSVKSEKTRSCGCYKKKMLKARLGVKHTHGHTINKNFSKTYVVWAGMLQRCNDPKHVFYYRYGGKGIKVCKRWEYFENFLEDMGIKPSKLTIERINNNGNYCKDNCKWATRKQQGRNKSNTIIIKYNDQKIPLKEALELYNSKVKYNTAFYRYKNNWNTEEILYGKN